MDSYFFLNEQPSALIHVSDEDAADFLQSQLSNDVVKLGNGKHTHALLLNLKGKIVGDCHVLRRAEDDFLIFSAFTPASVILERFEHYLIADDVELDDLTSKRSHLTVYGAAVDWLIAHLGIEAPALSAFVASNGLLVFTIPRADLQSLEILAEPALLAELVKALELAGVESIDAERVKYLRVLAGIPAVPADATEQDFPQECGHLASLVSYNKGCYLGQEIMAGIRKTGRTTRTLALLELDCCPQSPEITADGKVVGELRSFVPASGKCIAIAMIRRKTLEAASPMACGQNGECQVRMVKTF